MNLLLALCVLVSPAFAGGKKPKTPTPPPPVEISVPPVVEETAPPPPPAPEPPKNNADFHATIAHADGHTVTGHVVRVERGDDWYADNGWVDATPKLTVELEAAGTNADKAWTDISTIDVKYGTKSDIDCTYESEFTPWMYTCTLKTTAAVKTKDAKSWTSTSRYKWRFTFEDGSTDEFFLYKLPARKQDTTEVTLDSVSPENAALYAELQAEVQRAAAKSVTKITITP